MHDRMGQCWLISTSDNEKPFEETQCFTVVSSRFMKEHGYNVHTSLVYHDGRPRFFDLTEAESPSWEECEDEYRRIA